MNIKNEILNGFGPEKPIQNFKTYDIKMLSISSHISKYETFMTNKQFLQIINLANKIKYVFNYNIFEENKKTKLFLN